MIVMGIVGGFHDPAACLLVDGKIVAIAEEERFSRRKHDYGAFPDNAAQYCLKAAGALWRDVDRVVYPFDLEKLIETNVQIEPWKSSMHADRPQLLAFKEYYGSVALRVKTWCAERNLPAPDIVDHHSSHLACALYGSRFDTASLLSLDSRGELHSTVTALGNGATIEEIHRVALPHSLGMLYTSATQFLGYNPYDGEGTVMGLAPYGEDLYREVFDKAAFIDGDFFRCEPSFLWNARTEGFVSGDDAFERHFGPARPYRPDPRDGTDEHIAASLQANLSRIVKHMVEALMKRTGIPKLCIAGGIGLNSKLNGEIFDLDCVEDLYVFPLANDAGCAVGGAYLMYNKLTGKRPEPLDSVLLGPGFTDEEARNAAIKTGFTVDEPANLPKKVARLIADGKVVGWVQGRMEAGPRALGSRSILADPSRPESKDRVNIRVKRRENWRPFAATILDTHRDEYLEKCSDARFMIVCYPVKSAAIGKLSAASHIDNTNRAQVIERDSNPPYYDLVREFGDITGTYALLNTSFNLRGQPIARTPAQAARILVDTDMDALAVGRYLIVKP